LNLAFFKAKFQLFLISLTVKKYINWFFNSKNGDE